MRRSIAVAVLVLAACSAPLLVGACSGSSGPSIDPGVSGPGIDQDGASYVPPDGTTTNVPPERDASSSTKDAGGTVADAAPDAPELDAGPGDAGGETDAATDASSDSGPDANVDPLPILSESFAGITGGTGATQCQTNAPVLQSANLAGWTKSGTNAVNAVQIAAGDYAAAFFNDGAIVTTSGVAANTAGTTYAVRFRAGPSAGNACGQATKAGDGLVISVLRGDDSVLGSYTFVPGAWSGAQTLANGSFTYVGDGSGNVRLRITTNLAGTNRFGGAIDDVVIAAQ